MLSAMLRRLLAGSRRRTGTGIPRCHQFGDILDSAVQGPAAALDIGTASRTPATTRVLNLFIAVSPNWLGTASSG